LIDDEWAAFGSYNFEHAAHDRLAEAMLASRDVRATKPASEIFAGLRKDSDNIRVTPQAVAAWPARLRARRWLFGRFKRWL
jgi:phosphatidylserine/phosphatidylglycerophosphate/cardiolipin synthase-like enzyme